MNAAQRSDRPSTVFRFTITASGEFVTSRLVCSNKIRCFALSAFIRASASRDIVVYSSDYLAII